MKNIGYEPEVCEHCTQTTTYILGIDLGTIDIVKAISVAIGRKRINMIHPWKEMMNRATKLDYRTMTLEGELTPIQLTNLSRPRSHGLIAQVREHHGNYCMTTKGAKFLKGLEIPRYAIMSKSEHHQIGYFKEHECRVTIRSFDRKGEPYWDGIGYDIIDGKVIFPEDSTTNQQTLL